MEEEGILVMHKIIYIGFMLDFCIRICNFFSFWVYHDQSAQIYNDSENMAQFAGLAKLMSSKSNVKIVERSWTCKCHTYISCEIVEASKVFFFFFLPDFLLMIYFPLDVIKICHVTLLSFMKLSKLWNLFVALVQQQCHNFFVSGWLIMKSFAFFLSSWQFASNPSQASMCTVFVHHISSIPSMFDDMFQYQSGKFHFS